MTTFESEVRWTLRLGTSRWQKPRTLDLASSTGQVFALGITRANSRRVPTRCPEKRRLTGPSGKGGSNFSKEAIIDSCGPRDRGRCKKRIETSATFQGYERHAENPIGTCTFSLFLYLALSVTVLLSVLPFLLNISAAQGPPRTTLVAWRNIQYPRYTGRMKPKETDSGSIANAILLPNHSCHFTIPERFFVVQWSHISRKFHAITVFI